MCGRRRRICNISCQNRGPLGLVAAKPLRCGKKGGMDEYQTYLLGLSRRPPRLEVSWQQDKMYRIKPFRLNKLSSAEEEVGVAVSVASPSRGPVRLASIKGQHPPTQWL